MSPAINTPAWFALPPEIQVAQARAVYTGLGKNHGLSGEFDRWEHAWAAITMDCTWEMDPRVPFTLQDAQANFAHGFQIGRNARVTL